MERRDVLKTMAIAGLAAGAGGTGARAQSTGQTFVLVHGAWHGGWCWARVADRLRAAGHPVHAPTLTGLCGRSHLLALNIDLTTHVKDGVNEVLWKDLSDIVLVGHSYGGMVITGAADQLA